MPENPSPDLLIPMRIVTQRTGLTPDLLRAWERRYGAVKPTRTAGGQRLYTQADVARLQLLSRVTRVGRPIGQVATLPDQELQRLLDQDERAAALDRVPASDDPAADRFLARALTAVESLDGFELEQTLKSAVFHLSSDRVLDEVVGPLLFTIGSLWHQGVLQPANEHLASQSIRRVLTWMSEGSPPAPGAPVLLVGTPAHHVHELGAMLAATTAAGNGWRAVHLGADLPAAELARAARHVRADAVALSLVFPLADAAVADELRLLRRELGQAKPILVGGSGADSYRDVLREIGAEPVTSLGALRRWLRAAGPAVR